MPRCPPRLDRARATPATSVPAIVSQKKSGLATASASTSSAMPTKTAPAAASAPITRRVAASSAPPAAARARARAARRRRRRRRARGRARGAGGGDDDRGEEPRKLTDVPGDAEVALKLGVEGGAARAQVEVRRRADERVPREERADALQEEDVEREVARVGRRSLHAARNGVAHTEQVRLGKSSMRIFEDL